MRQKFILTPFAATGDRESPPDAQQPDGSVSYAQGFGPDYEADPATSPTAKPVPREETNGIYFDLSDALRALQTQSAPEFITPEDNGGSPFAYDRGVAVRWSANGQPPFTTYVSRVNGNTAVPSNATNWSPLLFEAATNAQALAGSSSALIITPAALQYVLSQTAVTVPSATTTQAGTTRYATNAEAQSGSPAAAAVTPPALQSALGAYSFSASQVGSGTLAPARIPSLSASQIGSGVFDPARIPAVNIDTSQVTSGVLSVERGGTGAASWEPLSFLQVAGTGTTFLARTPAQVLNLIGAASLTGNIFTGPQQIRNASAANLSYSLALADGTPLADFSATSLLAILSYEGASSTGGVALRPNGKGATAGQTTIAKTGNMSVGGAVTATGGFQGSSRTVKRDIRPIPGAEALAIVEALQAVSFEHRKEYRDDGGKRTFGFIAEDMDKLLSEAVRHTPDGPSPLVIDQSQPPAVLWAAVGYLARRLKELEDSRA